MGRHPVRRRRRRLDRGRRRALRMEDMGCDPHSRVELAPPRQRRQQARALHELLVGAHALDAGHELDRRSRPRTIRAPASAPCLFPGPRRRRCARAPVAPARPGDREAPLGPHPYAVRRAGDPGHAARHPHQVPQRPRDRQPGLGAHAGDDPVRAGQDAVVASPSGRSMALRRRGPWTQLPRHGTR